MTRPSPWTDTENWALCSLYAAMSLRAVNGMQYNKAAMIREAQNNHAGPIDSGLNTAALKERSRGSIEAKLMNLTAVLESLGLTTYSMARHGYVPLANYQAALKEQAQRYWHAQLADNKARA